jgi:hypothetical protein
MTNKEKVNAFIPKNEIYLAYDLINFLAYEYCWNVKKQEKRKMGVKA